MKIANEIHKFNEQIKWGQGLKILTPSQMLRRLPISLAQLKAGNKFRKTQKRNQATTVFFVQIKKTYKQIYKSLVDII